MPTKEQMDAVARRIEEMETESYGRDGAGNIRVLNARSWQELNASERAEVITEQVGWEGFTESEMNDVITRAVDGEPEQFLMNGIDQFDDGFEHAVPESFDDLMHDIAVPPKFEEPATYQVWHADVPRKPGEPPLDFPEAYSHVADVRADGFEQAVTLTTHAERPWQENPGVEPKGGYRSTMIGDVLVDPQGQANRFEEQGFHQVARSGYDRMLQDAAERSKYRQEPEKGRDR